MKRSVDNVYVDTWGQYDAICCLCHTGLKFVGKYPPSTDYGYGTAMGIILRHEPTFRKHLAQCIRDKAVNRESDDLLVVDTYPGQTIWAMCCTPHWTVQGSIRRIFDCIETINQRVRQEGLNVAFLISAADRECKIERNNLIYFSEFFDERVVICYGSE